MNLIRFSKLLVEEQYRLCFWIFTHVYFNDRCQTYIIQKIERSFINEDLAIIKKDKSTKVSLPVNFIGCKISGLEIVFVPHPSKENGVILTKKSNYTIMLMIKYIYGIPAMAIRN